MENLSQLSAAIGMSPETLFVVLTGATVFCMGAILSGKLYRARAAHRMGLVDRLTKPELPFSLTSSVLSAEF